MIRNYFICNLLSLKNLAKFIFLVSVYVMMSVNLFSIDIVPIYDIQFTTDAGFDGTYPSQYINQQVVIQGVISAVGFEGNRYFVSESQGGAWSAVCVEDNSRKIAMGDFIELQGKVSEIMGMTVITNVQNLRTLLRNTPVPEPVNININEALTSEAYESVLVKLNNITCCNNYSGNYLAQVEDSNSKIFLGDGFNSDFLDINFSEGESYSFIIGIMDFSFNRFSVHPRNRNDVNLQNTSIQSSSWGKIKSLYR